jgi:hypothetical protein
MQVLRNYLTPIAALSQPCPSHVPALFQPCPCPVSAGMGDDWEGDDQEGSNQVGKTGRGLAGRERVRREQLGVGGPGGGFLSMSTGRGTTGHSLQLFVAIIDSFKLCLTLRDSA